MEGIQKLIEHVCPTCNASYEGYEKNDELGRLCNCDFCEKETGKHIVQALNEYESMVKALEFIRQESARGKMETEALGIQSAAAFTRFENIFNRSVAAILQTNNQLS